ncbi:MAG: energy-coupling factor transporter transmembrane component T [Halobacteriales archaeon]|nr:energy-coupling factor transporter transmembrane component T [Halobacteriales archaeon]
MFAHDRLDPRAKLVFVAVVSLLAVAIPRVGSLAALGAVLTVVVALGRGLSLRAWVGLLAPFKVLVPVILVLNAFFYGGGAVIWSAAAYGLPVGLTVGGLEASVVIAARLLVIAAAAAWFAATTSAESFEVALARIGVPWTIAFLVSLTLRLVPELRASYRSVEEAQRSRGLVYEGGPLARARARLPVFVPFFVAVIRYGYELGDALRVRGFGEAERRTYQVTLSFGRADALFSLASVVVLAAFAVAFTVTG